MKNFLPREQVEIFTKKLNSCYSDYHQWEHRKAQKVHKDLFGEEIKEGEYYFRISVDGYLGNDLKLSEINMSRFLYLVFAPSPTWEADADKTTVKKLEKAREIINKLLP